MKTNVTKQLSIWKKKKQIALNLHEKANRSYI